jgi:hypothetical protein
MQPNVTSRRIYGDSLFFEVVPMEMLNTDALTPQIMVTVDGMPALCLDLICDYTYTVSDSLLSTQEIDSTDLITITGTLLPNATTDRLWLGPVSCTLQTWSNETITCQLDDTKVAGEWKVAILTQYGYAPSNISTTIDVPIVADSISPATDVSYLGGDVMTITGDAFGYNPDVVSVTFDDGTACEVTSVSMTSITCVNGVFSSSAQGATLTATITINGVTDSSLSVQMLGAALNGLGVSPSSASPVLRTELTI